MLDTSVLLGADRHWLWSFAQLGLFEGVWSTFIVGELVRVRVERSLTHGVSRSIYREQINKLIHLLTGVLVVAHYPAAVGSNLLRDPDDEPILATALAAGADMVVSWNTRDFPPARVAVGVRFLTPVEFLAVLEARHPHERLGEQIRDAGRQLP